MSEQLTIDQLKQQVDEAVSKGDYALVTKLGHEVLTAQAKAAREAFEAKSAERAAITERLRQVMDDAVAEFMDDIESATGGAYHIVYDLQPGSFNLKIMDMPKERKVSSGEAKTFPISTVDLIRKYQGHEGVDWLLRWQKAEAADRTQTYTDRAGKVRVPGNARYAVRQELVKLEKGS